MPLYHKWGDKNAFTLQFFMLISDSLGGVYWPPTFLGNGLMCLKTLLSCVYYVLGNDGKTNLVIRLRQDEKFCLQDEIPLRNKRQTLISLIIEHARLLFFLRKKILQYNYLSINLCICFFLYVCTLHVYLRLFVYQRAKRTLETDSPK